jgi:putative PIN family toxin of toxin-antitoxin system
MRVVLDTNVLIAAFITHGLCSTLLEHCFQLHELVTSEFILSEFREKLIKKFQFDYQNVTKAVQCCNHKWK